LSDKENDMRMKKTYTFFLALIIMALCVSCADKPVNEPTSTPPSGNKGAVYTITDYYDENGGLPALGLALDEENAEKVLSVKVGVIGYEGALCLGHFSQLAVKVLYSVARINQRPNLYRILEHRG